MRNYGNLRKKIPITFAAMMIGTLAITGVGIPLTHFGFAGFLSKDAIIESTFAAHTAVGTYAFWMLVIAAAMTSFYSWRLIFLTFYGSERGDKHTHEHAHESPLVMTIPLVVLMIGSIFAGMVWYNSFFDKNYDRFFGMTVAEAHGETDGHGDGHGDGHHTMGPYVAGQGALYVGEGNNVMMEAHSVPKWVKMSPFFAMLFGFCLSWIFYIYNPELPKKLAVQQRGLYAFLLNKWYFDELYDLIFVRPAKWIGRFLWKKGDGSVIDGGINGLAMGIVPFVTRTLGRWQSGYLFHYAFAMFIGLAAIITWFVIGGAG